MTAVDKNGKKVTITRQFNSSTGNIDFFTDVAPGTDPAFVEALKAQSVNLSRGHTRMYSLVGLSDHNGTGANWKDGRDIHTAARQQAYTERCEADIVAALGAAANAYAKAVEARRFDTAVVTVASC